MSTCLMHSNLSTAKHWENFHDIFNTSPKVFLQIWHRGSLVCTLNIYTKYDFNFDQKYHFWKKNYCLLQNSNLPLLDKLRLL